MSVEQVVKLDIVPQKNPPHVRVTEYDYGVNSWVIVANLFKDGLPWEPPTGTTAAIEGTKKDGTVFRTDGHVMYWPGEPSVIFTLEDNMTDVSGAAWVKIVLTINGSKLATCGLWLDIDKAGADASAVVGGNGFEEVLNEAFGEYLEEHGTAPIGSGVESVNGKSGVVMLKMSDIEDDSGIEVAETYDDLLKSTADRVRVIDNTGSPFNLRGSCDYYKSNLSYNASEKSPSAAYAYRETTDKAIMLACPDQIPTPPSNAPIVALGDCIASYILPVVWNEHSDRTLDYGNKGLFDTNGSEYDTWSASQSYNANKYVIHNGVVYRTLKAVTGVEPNEQNSKVSPTPEEITNYTYQKYLSTNLIDCSMFMCAVLGGITYDHSRYVRGADKENVYGQYVGDNYLSGLTYNIHRYWHGLGAAKLPEWFAQQRRLFRFHKTHTFKDKNNNQVSDDIPAIRQLRFGDVVFEGDPNEHDDSAYHSDHCMMVLKVYDDGHVLFAQAGGNDVPGRVVHTQNSGEFNGYTPTCKLTLVDMRGQIGDGKSYQVFARPNYGGAEDKPHSIQITVNNVDVSGSGELKKFADIYCEPIVQHNAYTLILDGDLPNGEDSSLVIRAVNGNTSHFIARVDGANLSEVGRVAIPFVMSEYFGAADRIAVDYYDPNGAETGTFSLNSAALVHGIVDDAEMTDALHLIDGGGYAGVADQLKTQILDVIPDFQTRKGRAVVNSQTVEWKIVKRSGTRYSIGIIGSGGAGLRRECINGTATDTTYTESNPVPLEYVY